MSVGSGRAGYSLKWLDLRARGDYHDAEESLRSPHVGLHGDVDGSFAA